MMLIGEAWGKDEEAAGGTPFVGAAGRVLSSLLHRAGIRRDDCYITNVFALRPKPSNDVKNLCGNRAAGIPGWPQLSTGKYVLAQYAKELTRLFDEIKAVRPNLIVALGATPTWALSHLTPKITQVRGSPFMTPHGKVLATYHPAAVMRDWSLDPIVWADFNKAKREDAFPEVRAPQREVWIEPTLDDLLEFERLFIEPSPELSVDIETKGNQIECIGFAPDPAHALVVPFYSRRVTDGNYWPTHGEELQAWAWVRRVIASKRIVFQNGLFDMQHIWKSYGLPIPKASDDTMLLHHALQPEMKKSLGFMASIQTDEPGWKFMGRASKKEDE